MLKNSNAVCRNSNGPVSRSGDDPPRAAALFEADGCDRNHGALLRLRATLHAISPLRRQEICANGQRCAVLDHRVHQLELREQFTLPRATVLHAHEAFDCRSDRRVRGDSGGQHYSSDATALLRHSNPPASPSFSWRR
jgi:hypothetical protein